MKEMVFDTSNAPAYALSEAAHHLKLPLATLRSWVVGRSYPKGSGHALFKPLIVPSSRKPPMLSFCNLIEAHILRALRTEHGVSLTNLRKALAFAERDLQIEHLLLSPQLRTDAGRIFLDQYGKLIELSASGQLAMRRMFEEHLKRVEWDQAKFPARLFPFLSGSMDSVARPIVIDPRIAFGRPVLASRGISTQTIAERIDAGETVDELARDYDLQVPEIEEAVLYERAA